MDYNLKIFKSGDMVELWYYNNYLIRESKTKSNNNINKNIDLENIELNKEHCRRYYLSTVKSTIIRLVNCNKDIFKSFITLTYKEDVSEDDNTKYLNLLFTKLRKTYPNLAYVWTLERTKKGRIHIHLLTNISFENCNTPSNRRKSETHKSEEVAFENTYWTYIGNVLGFVDIRSVVDSVKYAKYIIKYMTKDNDVVATNKHIYGYSRKTLQRPHKEIFNTKLTLEEILQHFKDGTVEYSSNYEIEYGYNYKATVSYFNINIGKDCD